MPLWVTWILVPLIVQAQSGDPDTQKEDSESRLVCTSHISTHTDNSLTCNLVEYIQDDEDEDSIENITVCCRCVNSGHIYCWNKTGNNITISQTPVHAFNVTIHLRRGGVYSRIVDLRKIVKPKRPRVSNAAFHPQNNQAVIYIKTAYHQDYLTLSNQLFQFHIWSAAGSVLTQNVTGTESLIIEGEYLKIDTVYHVKVRAIPSSPFKGTWSDWSKAGQFYTKSIKQQRLFNVARDVPLVLSILSILSIVFLIVAVRRKSILQGIQTYMEPSIPKTLVPIYKQVKLSFAMNFEPDQFSHMNIQPMKKTEERPSSEAQATSADEIAQREDGDLCLNRELLTPGTRGSSTSDTSTFTGESASTLLSLSSVDGMYSQPMTRSPSPSVAFHPESSEDGQGDPSPEVNGPTQPSRDAVYVTMSSFYHSKDQRNP